MRILTADTTATSGVTVAIIFTLLGVVIAGLVSLVNGILTSRVTRNNARREAWWDRAQWAMEHTYDENATARAIGLTVLNSLVTSRLATEQDSAMMGEVALALLNPGGTVRYEAQRSR